ncbi:MAG: hypothetical protein ACOZCO_16925 [Bacteroidota bacterium]
MSHLFSHSRTFFLLFLFPAVIFTSCGSKTDLTAEEVAKNLMSHYEPDMVMAMEPGQLIEKSGIAEDGMIPGEMKFMFGEQLDYILDEEKSGLGFKGKSFVMAKWGEKEPEWFIMVFNLSNKENFEKMIKEEMEVEPKETDGYMSVYKKGTAIGWYETFGISVTVGRKKKDEAEPMLAEMMKKAVEKTETVKPEYEEILNDKSDFATLYDIHSFMPMALNEARGDEKEMLKAMMEWTKEAYTFYTLNFETDKITAKVKNTFSDKSKKEFDAMMREGIDPSFTSCLTDSSLIGFMTFAANPEPIYNFIGKLGGEEFQGAEIEFRNKLGIDLLDMVKTFTGDVAISMIDIERKQMSESWVNENGEEEMFTYEKEMPVMAIIIGTKDNTWQQIMDTVPDIEKKESYYIVDKDDAFVAFSNNKVIISTSEKLAAQFGTTGKLSAWTADGVEKNASQHTAFGYLDFKALWKVIPENERGAVEDLFGSMDYAVAYGNTNETVFELRFEKTGKNSLYNLTSAVMGMMSLEKYL